jgi:hypothetical protein
MKHLFCTVLLLAMTATGCVTGHQEITKGWQARPPAAPPPPPPVTAGQVSRENAHAVSQALWDEMDRVAQNEALDQPSAKTSPAKK